MTASTAQRFAAKRSKYHAVKTRIDDFLFDSKAEARIYCELKLRARAGEINGLTVKPRLDLHTVGPDKVKRKVCAHVVDFKYFDTVSKEWRWLECKGYRHSVGELKRKWAEIEHGISIEVRK